MKQDQRKNMGEMAVIKKDSFPDHRPIAIILRYQVKEPKKRGAKQTKRLDLNKSENEEIRKFHQKKQENGQVRG